MKNYLSLCGTTFVLLLALYFLLQVWIAFFSWLPKVWAVPAGLALAAACSSGVAMFCRSGRVR